MPNIPTFTRGTDSQGNVFCYGDEEARAVLETIDPQNIAIGTRITSSVPLQPQTLYGGTWVEEAYHNFNADYVYTKVSNAETEAAPEEGDTTDDPQ